MARQLIGNTSQDTTGINQTTPGVSQDTSSLGQNSGKTLVGNSGQQPVAQGGKYDWLPMALGTAGNIVGTVGGGLLGGTAGTVVEPGGGTILGGIGGARVGGMALSAAGQGIGEAINELLSGQQLNGGKIGGETLQGAAYGMLPGGKLTGGILKNAATRFVGGSLVGSGAQAIRNVENQQPITNNVGSSGFISGGLNTLLPGAAETLGIGGKAAGKLASTIGAKGKQIAGQVAMVPGDIATALFGGKAIDFSSGKEVLSQAVQSVIKRFEDKGLTLPPNGSQQAFAKQIPEIQKQVESELKPVMEQYDAVSQDVKNNLQEAYKPLGRTWLQYLPDSLKKIYLSNSPIVNLYTLKEAQRDLAEKIKWSPNAPTTEAQDAAKAAWTRIDDIIQQELGRTNNTVVKDLNTQHSILIQSKNLAREYQGSNGWPDILRNAELAKNKRTANLLAQMREQSMFPRVLGGAMAAGTAALPGVGLPIKALALLAEASLVAPYAFPETAPMFQKLWNGISKTAGGPANSQNIMKALGQLGVRVPGMMGQ